MMMAGGKKEMPSRNVLIFRRKVTWTQMAVFSINWKSRQARLIFRKIGQQTEARKTSNRRLSAMPTLGTSNWLPTSLPTPVNILYLLGSVYFTRLGDYGDDSIWPSSSKVDQDRRGD